uniref:Myosin motor domain-containing protein n=1 Tax=Haptolina ericina TaxID=156174 RepID=A0A7S3FEF1_9EUKA
MLLKVTTSRTLSAGRKADLEEYSVPLNVVQAQHSRDAIAKMVYAKVFNWLVARINESLAQQGAQESHAFIGILDIYGFEVFQTNSFEQLCINYANEQLQQHFIVHTFKQEQELYKHEGIQWKEVPYSDNRDCLELLQDSKRGLFSLLDEICRMPKPKDEGYLERVYSDHLGKSKRLQQPRPGKDSGFIHSAREAFVVDHFAGKVCYAVMGFVSKNTDALTVDCELALAGSRHSIMGMCFKPAEAAPKSSDRPRGFGLGGGGGSGGAGGTGARAKKATVSSSYMSQMAKLQEDLQACAPHFIRCIKTNRASKANAFDGSYVLMQLRCSGMMEALELMQAGYPTRCPYKELATRYRPVMPPAVSRLSDALFVEAILEALEMERTKYKLGITRVFFRAGQLAFLERLTGQGDISSEEIVTRVTKWLHNRRKRMIRLGMLGMLVFTRMLRVIRLARMLQAATRILLPLQRWCNRATATRRSKAATAIQALVRGSLASRRWRAQRWGVLLLQRLARGMLARRSTGRMVQVQRKRQEAANAVRADHARRRQTRMSTVANADLKKAQAQHLVKASTDAAQSAAGQPPRRNPTVGIRGPSSPETTPSAAVAVMPAEVDSTLKQLLELSKQQSRQLDSTLVRLSSLETRVAVGGGRSSITDGGYSEREEEDEAVGILSSNSASIAGFDPQQ